MEEKEKEEEKKDDAKNKLSIIKKLPYPPLVKDFTGDNSDSSLEIGSIESFFIY